MFSSEQIFKVNGDKREQLLDVLKLVGSLSGSKVAAYSFDEHTFKLFWHYDSTRKQFPLPTKMEVHEMTDFVMGFLKQAQYGEADDMDGDYNKGWCVEHNSGGSDDAFYTIVTVTPMYTYYAK